MAAPTTIYTMSLRYINGVCDTYVGQNVAAVAHVVGPFATTMLTLYVVLWGFASMRGVIKEPLSEFMHRVIIIAIVFGIGFNLANYNTLITNTFLHGPDELVGGLAQSSGTTGVVNGLDAMLQQGFDLGGRFWAKAGVLDGDFGMYFVALFVYAITLVVTAYAFFLMALSKVALTVLIGIGPIFFIGLLFQGTRGFFNSWLRQIANYFLVPVLVVMVNLLILNLFKRAANSATAITDTTDVAQVFPFFAMGLVCLLALASVLSIAAGLAGGVSLSSFGMGRLGAGLIKHHGTRLSKQIVQQGGRAVALGGKTVARGAWSAYQSRSRNSIRPAKTATKPLTYKA
jgi:type IV secretion system protein VirB6